MRWTLLCRLKPTSRDWNKKLEGFQGSHVAGHVPRKVRALHLLRINDQICCQAEACCFRHRLLQPRRVSDSMLLVATMDNAYELEGVLA